MRIFGVECENGGTNTLSVRFFRHERHNPPHLLFRENGCQMEKRLVTCLRVVPIH